MADVEVEKLGLSHATDYDAIRAEVKEVFNPYDQLGINKTTPLAEIQLKLKVKKRIINEELQQIDSGSNLPAVYEDRLSQLQKDLDTIEKSAEIFSTIESRRKFNNEYELEVHRIINRNLSFRQKLSLQTTKTYQYALDTLRPKVPSPVRTGELLR